MTAIEGCGGERVMVPTAPQDASHLLTAAIRAILLLAALAGFVERSGVASALWSVFVGVGPR